MLAHASRFGALLSLLVALSAAAQAPREIPRIGFLSPTSATTHAAPVAALLQGLREAGYQVLQARDG